MFMPSIFHNFVACIVRSIVHDISGDIGTSIVVFIVALLSAAASMPFISAWRCRA